MDSNGYRIPSNWDTAKTLEQATKTMNSIADRIGLESDEISLHEWNDSCSVWSYNLTLTGLSCTELRRIAEVLGRLPK